MSFFFRIILILFFFFNLTLLNAAEKYVYVNMDLLVNSSVVGKQIYSDLTKMHRKKLDELKKIEDELKKGEIDIVNQKNVLSKEEFNKRLNELRNKAKSFQKQRNNNTKSISEKRIKATNKLLNLIEPILTEFANKNSISIIFQKKSIVIGKTESDITDQILKILNEKYKKIKLN
jgi:outer membrane protein